MTVNESLTLRGIEHKSPDVEPQISVTWINFEYFFHVLTSKAGFSAIFNPIIRSTWYATIRSVSSIFWCKSASSKWDGRITRKEATNYRLASLTAIPHKILNSIYMFIHMFIQFSTLDLEIMKLIVKLP